MIRNIISLALSVLLAVGAIGGYVFLLDSVNASVQRIAVTEGSIASAGKRATFADSMQAFLAGIASERAELEAITIGEDGVASVIEAIEAEAKRNKVEITVSSVLKGTVAGWKKHGTVRLNLTGEGSYQALATFAAALETLPVASHLSNFSLQVLGEEKDKTWYGEFTVILVARLSPSP
jgi:hypothetical protein